MAPEQPPQFMVTLNSYLNVFSCSDIVRVEVGSGKWGRGRGEDEGNK